MISHKHRFIFVHIPKTGGTSIAYYLYRYCEKVIKHQFAEDLFGETREGVDYFTFSLIRNPWEREVSRYFYQRQTPDNELYEEARQLTFKEWLHRRQQDEVFMRFYGAPMLDWLTDENGNLLVEYIARLERINDDWKKICERLNHNEIYIDTELPYLNRSEHNHYTEYYDDETRGMIEAAYQRDIEFFNYRFEG